MDLRQVKDSRELPDEFNMCTTLLDRHLAEGRGSQTAILGPLGTFSYNRLYHLTCQVGYALRSLGLDQEQRVLLLLRDSPEFIATFLAAMRIGAVPVPLNTFAHPKDYDFFLRHSRARMIVGDAEFLAPLEPLLRRQSLRAVVSVRGDAIAGAHLFLELVSSQPTELDPVPTHKVEPSHWVYTSGSTGDAKAVVHLYRNTPFFLEPYVRHAIQMTPGSVDILLLLYRRLEPVEVVGQAQQ